MENPCKLLLFGDSITKGYAPILNRLLNEEYPEIDLTVFYEGISGETSRDGLKRLERLLDIRPDIVVIGFGMNDWRKGVTIEEYRENLLKMLKSFESVGSRVIISTVSPSYNFERKKYNLEVDRYSQVVRDIAYEKKIKIADINALWKREIRKVEKGLRDELHPNRQGYELICKCLMWIVTRKYTTVLWQYNGREAKCNYRCPYCYYLGLHNPEDRFTGNIEQWHDRFKESFGTQKLILYLAYGEPTIGKNFNDILDMVGSEPNWKIRITSNISSQIGLIEKSKIVKNKQININASFHPSMIKREAFIKKILKLRDLGIEVPIIYVAYPEYISRLSDDIDFFTAYNFLVHVRRYQGMYKNKLYPWGYTDLEKQFIAKYSDDGMIKYLLNQQKNTDQLTYSGLHFFVMDNAGNVGYDSNLFHPYTKYRCIFGNINTGNFRPNLLPEYYPGKHEGTVDGVANLVDYNYKELVENNITSFAKQGGVFKDERGKVIYSNLHKNFNDPYIRAEFNFPPRDIKDRIAILRASRVNISRKDYFYYTKTKTKNVLNKFLKIKSMAKNILNK